VARPRKELDAASLEQIREHDNRYYRRHRERIVARRLAYHRKNRSKVLARNRAHYAANRDRLLAEKRAHRAANIERFRARDHKYRAANPQKQKEHNKKNYSKHREARIAYSRTYYQANRNKISLINKTVRKDKLRDAALRRHYGISLIEFRAMAAKQRGRCLICRKVPHSGLSVDHCHKSGKIRGLLCRACNSALGQIADNRQSLLRAVTYLESVA
jgi:hypothetical protein